MPKKVAQFGNNVLYIFLGTCHLTLRKGKYIELRHDNNALAISYLQYQIIRYLQFVFRFQPVFIVFLEIPPYSIETWDKRRGHREPANFHSQDLLLCERILLVNEYIKKSN